MVAGEDIYTITSRPINQGGSYYLYSPLFAFLFIPFTFLPITVGAVVWCLLNVFLIYWSTTAFYEVITGVQFRALPVDSRWIMEIVPVFLSLRFSPPTAQQHYFVFLLPSYVYVIYVWHRLRLADKWFRGLAIASFVVGSLTTDGICGQLLGDIFNAAGCIPGGTLLLAAAIFRAESCLRRNSGFDIGFKGSNVNGTVTTQY